MNKQINKKEEKVNMSDYLISDCPLHGVTKGSVDCAKCEPEENTKEQESQECKCNPLEFTKPPLHAIGCPVSNQPSVTRDEGMEERFIKWAEARDDDWWEDGNGAVSIWDVR